MKFLNNTVHGTQRSSWRLATAGVLITALASLGFVGGTGIADLNGSRLQDDDGGSGGAGGAGGPGASGLSMDDEFVGTLPTERNDEQPASPGFYLEGPRETVLSSFVAMTGPGSFLVTEVGSDAEPEVRLTFVGELHITLDKCVLTNAQTKIGVFANSELGATLASAMTEATLLMIQPIPAEGSLEVPLSEYEQGGLLNDGINVVTFNRTRGRDAMSVTSGAGVVEITQGMSPLR